MVALEGVRDTHKAPPLLREAELFWRRKALALLKAAGWVCSRVAFKGWKRDTGPGCQAQEEVVRAGMGCRHFPSP